MDNSLLNDLFSTIKPMRVHGADVDWKGAWGKSGVAEKRLVSKADEMPFSVTLKRFPRRERLTEEGGYEVHSHSTTEIGYVTKGRVRIFFEDIGEKEYVAGDLIVQPARLKHAAVSAAEDTEILAINIPPAQWEE